MQASAPSAPSRGRKELAVTTGEQAPDVQTRVYFHVEYPNVSFGEHVRVVGDHPSLGSWDPQKGIALTTNEDIFPVWASEGPTCIDLHTKVEYKYVVCHSDGRHKEWEDVTGNRSFVANGAEMTIEDDDGAYRIKMGLDEEDSEGDEATTYLRSKEPAVRHMDKEQKLSFVKELEGEVEISSYDTVHMLAFQLPIKVEKGADGQWKFSEKAPSDGRNFAFLPLLQELKARKKIKVINVGWPGVHVDSERDKSAITRLLAKHDYVPVFPPRQEFENFMQFCVGFLWPVFHDSMNSFQSSKKELFNEKGWAAYQHINMRYANAVVPHTHVNDMIWIQDYHLMCTPTCIARKLNKANIGFYLHAPFPSSDSFKSLPIREELLTSMLCADQLGFQFFTYARNFLVSCKRIFGLDPVFRAGGFMGLDYNGRNVMIKASHFAYPFQATKTVVMSQEVENKTAQVRKLFKGKTVFTCMDRCDDLSGLFLKFQAFREFLSVHTQHKGKAVLVQYCFLPLGELLGEPKYELALKSEADAFVMPTEGGELQILPQKGLGIEDCDIFLRISKVERSERLALFRAADVLLDTSVKNGLNLMPFEFIAAHHDGVDAKVCIVSEFSGCSRVLLGSYRVNPWNKNEMITTFQKALTLPADEKQERWKSNLQYVSKNSPMEWFEDFLTDLRRARKKDDVRVEQIGFGARSRQVCVGTDFRKLSMEAVLQSYRNSKNRVLFFDNEGTLATDQRQLYARRYGAPEGDVADLQSRGSGPNEHVLKCLRNLCADSRNTVVILSGRNKELMEEWFGSVPRIGLAAERGFNIKLPFATGTKWACSVSKPDYTWKTFAFEIMRQFVRRTQGSFVENKGSALVWQYRDADQHFGSMQAKELSSHLKELLFGFDLEILEGKGYVEVKVRGIHKGTAVSSVLQKVSQAFGEVDFVLCIGDDRSDEDMFEAVNQILDPTEEADIESLRSTTDAESDDLSQPGVPRETKSEQNLLGRRQSSGRLNSGKLSKLAAGGGGLSSLCSSGDLRGSLGGGLASLAGEDNAGSFNRRFFTCTVGRKPSAAKFFVDDTDEVSEILTSLRQQTDRRAPSKDSNSYTWSGGDLSGGRSGRVKQMNTIASLQFSDEGTL